ncbi:MAG: LamG domain-containing protein [Candidatus Woesearchaeota archaeon]
MNKWWLVIIYLVIFLALFLIDVSAISRTRFDYVGTNKFTYLQGSNITLNDYPSKLGLLYHFDNQSEYGENDTFIYDFSGHGRNGIIQGASINTTQAKYNYSVTLNSGGVLKNVTLNYTIPDGTSFTINFWAYRVAWDSHSWFLGIGEAGTEDDFIGLSSTGTFRFDGSTNTCPTSYILPANQWTMITVSCQDSVSGNLARFYINGTLIGTDTTGVCNGYAITSLGYAFTGTYMLIGNVDELAVWETVLDDSDISLLYTNTYPIFHTAGNYSQIFQSYNNSLNVSTDTTVRWRSYLQGNSSINIYACVGNNYVNCRLQTNGAYLNLSQNGSQVQILAELIADPENSSNRPYLEMLEPPKLSFYVDNQSSLCTDSNTIISAMNRSHSFCTIEAAAELVESDSEMIVRYGQYCDGIAITNSGTELYPILINGETSVNKPILNGSCADESNGIELLGEDYINYSNFEIVNFSNDALNIHGDSINVNFQAIYGHDNGYSHTSAAGDCISFHDTAHGAISRDLNCSNNYKSTIVDIQSSISYYYNIYGKNNRLYGAYFYGAAEGSTNDVAYHEINNMVIDDSPGCFWSEVESSGYDITCNNITGKGIYLAYRNNLINRFKVNTSGGLSIKILGATIYNISLIDGSFNENITVINSTNVILTNVTYNLDNESVDMNSKLIRKWYLTLGSTQEGITITAKNSSGNLIYSNVTSSGNLIFSEEAFIGYINTGGNITNETLTITASRTGYNAQNQSIILTNNTKLIFTLTGIISQIDDSSSGGGNYATTGGGYSTFKLTSGQFKEGYQKKMYKDWRMKFEVLGEGHELKVDNVFDEYATITISSEPQTFNLGINETKKLDMNNDSYYDLLVSLNDIGGIIDNHWANISISSTLEKIPVRKEIVNESINESIEQKSAISESSFAEENSNIGIFSILGLLIILVLFLAILRFRPKSRSKKK